MKNKYGREVEYAELLKLGCTKEALDVKYNGSDSHFYFDEESQTITEMIRGKEFVGAWHIADFLVFFNDLTDDIY